MYYDKKNYIVRDSKNKIYNFHIKDYKIILQSYCEKDLIIKDNVLEYSISIDKEDKIHIIYFNNMGELRHLIYYNTVLKDESIFLLNENCILNLLNIKIVNNKVHIFYILYYFDLNKICIYHNYFNEGNYIATKIGEACYYNYIPYYYVDCCKDNIYVLLNLNYKLGQYTMKQFNVKENKWNTIENNIYINNANNLVFFVTPQNKAIICFNECIKNNFQTFITYRDLCLQTSYWSNTRSLSNNNANTLKPIIFYKDKYIYIMWKQGNNLIYRRSKNIDEWEKESLFHIECYRDYIYISNYDRDLNLKVNYMNIPCKDFFEKIVGYRMEENNYLGIFNKSKKEYINEIKHKKFYFNKSNSNKNHIHFGKKYKILTNSVKKYELELQSFKNEISPENGKYLKVIYNYENKLKVLEEEKNEKIKSLLDIIEEKNNIIDKLNNLLKYKN